MLRKELGHLKLGLVIFQLLLILVCAPLTGGFLYQLLNGVMINTFTLGILFVLNIYGFHKCAQNRFPKAGHMVSFIAIAFQMSLPLYIIATAVLAVESYLLLTNQVPFQLKNWIYRGKKKN